MAQLYLRLIINYSDSCLCKLFHKVSVGLFEAQSFVGVLLSQLPSLIQALINKVNFQQNRNFVFLQHKVSLLIIITNKLYTLNISG